MKAITKNVHDRMDKAMDAYASGKISWLTLEQRIVRAYSSLTWFKKLDWVEQVEEVQRVKDIVATFVAKMDEVYKLTHESDALTA